MIPATLQRLCHPLPHAAAHPPRALQLCTRKRNSMNICSLHLLTMHASCSAAAACAGHRAVQTDLDAGRSASGRHRASYCTTRFVRFLYRIR